MRLLPILPLIATAAFAQNTDLGLLVGVSPPNTEIVSGTGAHIKSSVGGHAQINFAFQLKETTAGRLYLELPLLLGGHAQTTVGPGVFASAGGTVFFTPGVRWNFPVHSRLSPYVAAGIGLAGFGGNQVSITSAQVTTTRGISVGFAGGIGGGLDVRLSRLISLRAEARDFISAKGYGGTNPHNNVIFGFGMGFHW